MASVDLTDDPSLATLLDEVRPLIMEARSKGEDPRYLVLPKTRYDAVVACKARDRELGMPMLVLGMEVVLGDDPSAKPRVF
jgi:hypothetical protein